MVAVAVLGFALVGLLMLHHQDMLSVARGQELTTAAMLAQGVMSKAEMERFPTLGMTRGTFDRIYPGKFPNYHWERLVTPSGILPDVRVVEVRISYGPGFRRRFDLVEALRNPQPLVVPQRQ